MNELTIRNREIANTRLQSELSAITSIAHDILLNPAFIAIGGCILAQYARNHYFRVPTAWDTTTGEVTTWDTISYLDQTANAAIQTSLVSAPVIQSLAEISKVLSVLALIPK